MNRSIALEYPFGPRPNQLASTLIPISNTISKYAVADATAFGEEVQRAQKQIAKYERVEVATLVDEQATKANILRALRLLAGTQDTLAADVPPALQKLKAAQPEDAIFIYFAGHGTAHGAALLFVTPRPGIRWGAKRAR